MFEQLISPTPENVLPCATHFKVLQNYRGTSIPRRASEYRNRNNFKRADDFFWLGYLKTSTLWFRCFQTNKDHPRNWHYSCASGLWSRWDGRWNNWDRQTSRAFSSGNQAHSSGGERSNYHTPRIKEKRSVSLIAQSSTIRGCKKKEEENNSTSTLNNKLIRTSL